MEDNYLTIGKVPEKLLSRWVFSAPAAERPEVLQGPGLGEDCAAVELAAGEILILSTDPITATEENIGYLAVHVTLNDLAAAGAAPIGLMATILLPPNYPESRLEQIFMELRQTAAAQDLAILGGHTEVTDAVSRAVVSIAGVGKIRKEKALLHKTMQAGDSIVMTKYAGLEGTAILAKAKAVELSGRFGTDFIRRAQTLDQFLSVLPESQTAMNCDAAGLKAMHDITEGGVLGALWELAAKADMGLEADLTAVPILRETIEISEFFDINPYKLISSGAMLMIAENGEALVEALTAAEIPAKVIGRLLSSKERVACYAGIRQAILPPAADEIYKVL